MKAITKSLASPWSSLLLGGLLQLTTPAGATEVDFGPSIERAQAVAREVVEEHETPGMALGVAVGGETIWTEGFGFANREQELAVSPDTRFGLGSVTKSLTMVLCARLVQAGVLDWDVPVEEYLPRFPYAGHGVTVRLIGAHLSGMGDAWAGDLRYTRRHFSTGEAYLEAVDAPLFQVPGYMHIYGTGTFTVIAGVIEELTGQSFEEALREWVLDPLGMQDTVPNDPRVSMPERTVFYDPRNGTTETVVFDPSYKLAGAGYLSTVGDMLCFGSALFDHEFLRPPLRAELFRDMPTSEGKPTGFGLGWRITEDQGQAVYYQPGGGPGISCYLVLYPERELVFIALSNHTRGPTGGRVMTETLEAFLAATESP